MKLYKSKLTGIVWKKVGHLTYECVYSGSTGSTRGDKITVGTGDDLVTWTNFTIFSPFTDYYEAVNSRSHLPE